MHFFQMLALEILKYKEFWRSKAIIILNILNILELDKNQLICQGMMLSEFLDWGLFKLETQKSSLKTRFLQPEFFNEKKAIPLTVEGVSRVTRSVEVKDRLVLVTAMVPKAIMTITLLIKRNKVAALFLANTAPMFQDNSVLWICIKIVKMFPVRQSWI